MKPRNDYREVYSTEAGTICSTCSKPKKSCSCSTIQRLVVRGDGNIRVRRETKGRGGKTVTTVTGLPLNRDQLLELLSALKRLIGSGGTEKSGVLELQGDHTELVINELEKRGYKPKRAGG